MFYVIRLKRALIVTFILILSIVVYTAKVSFSEVVQTVATIENPTRLIVLDAGHGEPDGGAMSNDGTRESKLNLLVAKELEILLQEKGYKVMMTRNDENNIADEDKQGSIRQIKVSDIGNRVDIINNSNADMAVSIHMNKFTSEKYFGWQTFYSKKSEIGKAIAEKIQKSIGEYIDRPNKRLALSISGIKIVDKTDIPVVIVECGFLSNNEEVGLLNTEEYRKKLAVGIADGIDKFYQTIN